MNEKKDVNQNKPNREENKDTHKVKERVYTKDYIMYVPTGLTESDKFKNVSVKEILKIWGYDHFYDEMVNHFDHYIDNNPNIDLIFYYDSGYLSMDINKQKLIDFTVWNWEKDRPSLVGGILFQNNVMSFHS